MIIKKIDKVEKIWKEINRKKYIEKDIKKVIKKEKTNKIGIYRNKI